MGEIEVNLKCTAAVALYCCFSSQKLSFVVSLDSFHSIFFPSKIGIFAFGRFVFRLSNAKQTRLSNKCNVDSQVAHSVDIFGLPSSLESIDFCS